MKKQGYLLLVLLMSGFGFCSCGQKDTKEAQDQTEETAKDIKEDSKTKETKDTKKENKTTDEENTEDVYKRQGVGYRGRTKPMQMRHPWLSCIFSVHPCTEISMGCQSVKRCDVLDIVRTVRNRAQG